MKILFEEFESATENRSSKHIREGRILKVILFGSFARGNRVADQVSGRPSNYQLLLVVDHQDLTEVLEYWRNADERLTREATITRRVSAPVDFIVHSLKDVNKQLGLGRYFFSDILAKGIALYEAPGHPFDAPKRLTPEAALAEAQGYFDRWFESAGRYFETGRAHRGKGWNNEAAFELHQATERFYACCLLVLTLFSPRVHRLNFLRSQAEQLAPSLADV